MRPNHPNLTPKNHARIFNQGEICGSQKTRTCRKAFKDLGGLGLQEVDFSWRLEESCWDHNFFQGPVATIGVTSDTRRSYGSMLCSYHVRDEGVGGRVQQNSIQSKSIDLCVKAARAYNKNKSSGLSFESSPLTLLSSWTSGCPWRLLSQLPTHLVCFRLNPEGETAWHSAIQRWYIETPALNPILAWKRNCTSTILVPSYELHLSVVLHQITLTPHAKQAVRSASTGTLLAPPWGSTSSNS